MPRLIVTDNHDERTFDLKATLSTLGRSEKATVVIRDQNSSREHCQIRKGADGWSIVDLNSRNGTLVNGCPINEHKLKHGDRIEIGNTNVVFVGDGADGVPLPPPVRATPKAPPPLRPELLRATREEQCFVEVMDGEHTGKKFYLVGAPLTFGRAKSNSVAIQDDRISGKHAEIAYDPASGMYVVRDLGSTNGTKVNGEKIKVQMLRSGALIDMGGLRMTFTDPKAPKEMDDKTPPSMAAVLPLRAATPGGGAGAPAAAGKAAPAGKGGPFGGGPFLIAIVSTIAILGGAYFVLPPVLRLFLAPPEKVAVNPESLIQANPSFEDFKRDAAEIFPGWQVRGEPGEAYKVDTENAKVGRACLLLKAMDEAGRPSKFMKAVSLTDVPLERGDAYHVNAWVRTADSSGAAGIEVEWLGPKGEHLGQSFSDLYSGDTPWTELKHAFLPPEGAAALRVACIGLGRFGRAWFDHVEVLKQPVADDVRPFRFKSGAVAAEFADAGFLALFGGDAPLLRDIEVRIFTQGGKALRQGLALREEGFPERKADGYRLRTRLWDLGSGQAVDFDARAVVNEGGIALDYRLKFPKAVNADQAQVVMTFVPGALSDGISLRRRDKSVVEHAAFPDTDEVSALSLGGAAHPLTIKFGTAVTCTAVEEGGVMRLVVTWPPDVLKETPAVLSFDVK